MVDAKRVLQMVASFSTQKFKLRHSQAERFIIPQLKALGRPLDQLRALEIGCGEGPKACALAPLFKEYVGIDLDEDGLTKGQNNAKALGITNADLRLQEASDLPDILANEQFDVIFLYAVLEHLTVEERLTTLMLCWEALPEDGLLYIGEAPNRIAPIDYHSSKLPYFHMMPPELAGEFIDMSSHESWIKRVRSEATQELGLYRNGQHVGFHEFQLAVAPLDELARHLIADNWSVPMMNLYPLRWFEPRNLDDFVELQRAGVVGAPMPPMFGRYWIEGILSRKPAAAPLRPVRFLPFSLTQLDMAVPDGLGARILPVTPAHPLRLTLAHDARHLMIGIGGKSEGAFRVYVDDTLIGTYDSTTIRQANADLWPIQSWTGANIDARAGQEVRFEALAGAPVHLCPPFTR